MNVHRRRSPVQLEGRALKSVERDGWQVVLEYEGEGGSGPRVIDLSHRRKWLAQSGALSTIEPWGLTAPGKPGEVVWEGGFLAGRTGASQAVVWHLGGGEPGGDPGSDPTLTEVTDGWLLLGVVGSHVFSAADKLTTLDLADPKRRAPFLLQGPFGHIPVSIVVARNEGNEGAFFLACSRGYARDLVQVLTRAGEEFGIRAAGESALAGWLP